MAFWNFAFVGSFDGQVLIVDRFGGWFGFPGEGATISEAN